MEEPEVAVATSVKDDDRLAVVDSDGDGEDIPVPIGSDTAGFLADAAGIGGAAADDFPGVEIRNPVLVNTVAIVGDVGPNALDMSGGGAVMSAEIHIDTAGFLADDAGVGGNHPVAGDFTGVETSHTHNGRPHVQTKLG